MLSSLFDSGTRLGGTRLGGALLLTALAAGCATVPPPDLPADTALCQEQLLAQPGDGDLLAGGVGFRPAGQPYFLIDRLHAHFDVAALSSAAFSEWRSGVIEHSWQTLAAHQQRTLGEPMASSRGCLIQLAQATTQLDWAEYATAARDHTLYQDWQRWVGLYPLASPVVSLRIRTAQADWRSDYGGPFAEDGRIYQPVFSAITADQEDITDWFAAATADNPLGLPRLNREELANLHARHAPELKMLQASEADQLGQVVARDGEPQFSDEAPTAYLDHGFVYYDGGYRLQLSYTFWFRERPKPRALDLYGGPWNGITWRVTLDESGQPLVYDAIHNCGCYHHVWKPDNHLVRTDIGREEPLFLPLDWEGRPRLTLLPGTHFIRRVVAADRAPEEAIISRADYGLAPYRDLLVLADESNPAVPPVSLFDADGLVAGSQRLERFVLWPFGVQSPGAMRRNGTHAIAFVGKRYFDDPLLFEQLLEPVD